jgi:hypothetical protein
MEIKKLGKPSVKGHHHALKYTVYNAHRLLQCVGVGLFCQTLGEKRNMEEVRELEEDRTKVEKGS